MSSYDPLESTVLRREFPALEWAFDQSAVQERFESTLLDPHTHRIERCELEQATYAPGDGCILRYQLEIRDQGSGWKSPALVTGRVFRSEAASQAYLTDRLVPLIPLVAGREESRPFARPAAVISPLRMAVCAFPMDGELPTLIGATDRRRVTAMLNEIQPLGPGRAPIADCEVEVVDYARQHRVTLRYLPDGQAGILYGKVTADSSGELAGGITSPLRERARQAGYGFHVPEGLAWDADLHLSLLGAIPGRPGLRTLKKRLRGQPEPAGTLSSEEMIEACARIAATVHATRVPLAPRRTIEDQLRSLELWIGEVRRFSPDLGVRLERGLRRVTASAQGPALDGGLCHGEFTAEQCCSREARAAW